MPSKRHYHFAFNHANPERERRLLQFANTNDDGNTNPESEKSPPEGQAPEQSEKTLDEMSAGIRGKLDKVRPLVAQATVNSPFVLREALEILEQEQGESVEIAELVREGREYIDGIDAGEKDDERKRNLINRIQGLLDRYDLSSSVTRAFERRAGRYQELDEMIGGTDLSELATVENELKLRTEEQGGGSMLTNADQWSDADVNALAQRLNIDETIDLKKGYEHCTPEEKAAIDAVVRETEISADDANPKKRKLLLIYRKLLAARKLAVMEKGDLGTEKSLGSMQDTERAVSKQLMHARKHLERTLQLRAIEMRKKWEALRQKYTESAGSTDFSALAAKDGISENALKRRVVEIEDTFNRSLREAQNSSKGIDVGEPRNLPKTSDTAFTRNADTLLKELNDLSWMESDDESVVQKGFLGTEVREQKTSEAWLSNNVLRLKRASTILNTDQELSKEIASLVELDGCIDVANGLEMYAEIAGRLDAGTATAQDMNIVYKEFDATSKRSVEQLLLAITSPAYLQTLRRDKEAVRIDTSDNNQAARDALWEELRTAEAALFTNGVNSAPKHPVLQHETCRALGISEQLSAQFSGIESGLQALPKMKGPMGTDLLRQHRINTAKLTRVVQELDALKGTKSSARIRSIPPERIREYEAVARTQETTACYNRADGIIYLNEQAIQAEADKQHVSVNEITERALYHETGHAIVDTLVHRTGAIPGLFSAISSVVSQRLPGDVNNETVNDLLLARDETWGITALRTPVMVEELIRIAKLTNEKAEALMEQYKDEPLEKLIQELIRIAGPDAKKTEALANQRTDARLEEMRMDELINKYASWKQAGGNKKGFFPEDIELFNILDGKYQQPPVGKFEIEDLTNPAQLNLALQETTDTDDGGEAAGGADDTEDNGEGGADKIEPVADIGEQIIKMQNKIMMIKEFVSSHMDIPGAGEFSSWVNEGEYQFTENIRDEFHKRTNDLDENEIQRRLKILDEKFIEVAEKKIRTIKDIEMEIKDAGGKQIHGIWPFIVDMRFVSVYDMIDMVKSGAEDLQRMWKRAGEAKQAEIGESLTKWISDKIPYAGQLKHEYKRRSHASELEEVKQWKDALEEADSIRLQELLKGSNNRDQTRAIIEILVERGRLDWNNENLWLTLKRLSGMNMPIEACTNNSLLRDKWLQDMITSIWTDKDKYFDWRQSNDSGIDSGKKKFTQVADQLSNFSGGLAGRLEHQLTMWIDAKEHKTPVPEDVNPHLYEELIHYSMRNGKMSMEQKLFYLVQGTAHGLISIDRLQALAGENGGVLNQFPMIDYFTSKNNTMPELTQLAKRLEEPDNKYKPGKQTTMWLHMEVLRDEDAKARMSKATSGGRSEELDHEDIPTIMAQADAETVMDLTGVLSGTRFKISREGAKNAYTGFGTKFKILARLAQLHKAGKAQFTKKDAAEAAQSIASYILYDNIITGNSTNGDGRISLDMNTLNTTKGPSTGKFVVGKFRDSNSAFVRDILSQIQNSLGFSQQQIDDLVRKETEQHTTLVADGREGPITKRKERNEKLEAELQGKLAKALMDSGNIETLIDILAGSGDNLLEEHQQSIDNQNDEKYKDDFINTYTMGAYFKSRSNPEAIAA